MAENIIEPDDNLSVSQLRRKIISKLDTIEKSDQDTESLALRLIKDSFDEVQENFEEAEDIFNEIADRRTGIFSDLSAAYIYEKYVKLLERNGNNLFTIENIYNVINNESIGLALSSLNVLASKENIVITQDIKSKLNEVTKIHDFLKKALSEDNDSNFPIFSYNKAYNNIDNEYIFKFKCNYFSTEEEKTKDLANISFRELLLQPYSNKEDGLTLKTVIFLYILSYLSFINEIPTEDLPKVLDEKQTEISNLWNMYLQINDNINEFVDLLFNEKIKDILKIINSSILLFQLKKDNNDLFINDYFEDIILELNEYQSAITSFQNISGNYSISKMQEINDLTYILTISARNSLKSVLDNLYTDFIAVDDVINSFQTIFNIKNDHKKIWDNIINFYEEAITGEVKQDSPNKSSEDEDDGNIAELINIVKYNNRFGATSFIDIKERLLLNFTSSEDTFFESDLLLFLAFVGLSSKTIDNSFNRFSKYAIVSMIKRGTLSITKDVNPAFKNAKIKQRELERPENIGVIFNTLPDREILPSIITHIFPSISNLNNMSIKDIMDKWEDIKFLIFKDMISSPDINFILEQSLSLFNIERKNFKTLFVLSVIFELLISFKKVITMNPNKTIISGSLLDRVPVDISESGDITLVELATPTFQRLFKENFESFYNDEYSLVSKYISLLEGSDTNGEELLLKDSEFLIIMKRITIMKRTIYVVTFNSSGGYPETASIEILNGQYIPIEKIPTFIKNNLKIVGWLAQPVGYGSGHPVDLSNKKIISNTTLYAKWG